MSAFVGRLGEDGPAGASDDCGAVLRPLLISNCRISAWFPKSNADMGSSMIIMGVSCTKARVIATNCF